MQKKNRLPNNLKKYISQEFKNMVFKLNGIFKNVKNHNLNEFKRVKRG